MYSPTLYKFRLNTRNDHSFLSLKQGLFSFGNPLEL